MTTTKDIRLSESQSFLFPRRIGSGHTFLSSRKLSRMHTVPKRWDERFLLYEPIPIAFGCFLSGNAEITFPSTTAMITAAASLPKPADVAPVVATATASTTAASSIVASAAGQKRKACP
jgi:hypothetical protein